MLLLGIEPTFSARTMNMNIYMNLKETLCLWPRTAFVKVKTKESALVGWSLSTYICVNVCMYVQKVHSCSKDRTRVLWGNELQSFITPVFLGFQGACFHSILFPCCIRFLCWFHCYLSEAWGQLAKLHRLSMHSTTELYVTLSGLAMPPNVCIAELQPQDTEFDRVHTIQVCMC